VVHSTFEAGSSMEQAISRPTQEVGYITAGQLDLWIGDTCFHLNVGDSFRIRGQSYRWSNPHDVPCVAIWVIAPPVY
jgi:mannose-6-phosphate isomerase-like protein (cupin superfamily)